MQGDIRIGLDMMRDLARAPGLALVLKERWKYSTWPTHKGRTGK